MFDSSQDVNLICSKCGKKSVVNADIYEVVGDDRLNFYKMSCQESEICPHCGNEMGLNIRYWQREFYYKKPDGKNAWRYFTLWADDKSVDCSSDGLLGLFESSGHDYFNIKFSFADALEIVNKLYKESRDEALLPIKNDLEEKLAVYIKMPKGSEEDRKASELFEFDTIESLIPELKRIIDSHDDVLKDAYLAQFPE